MNILVLRRIIKRRILANYRAGPDMIQKILPKDFRPQLQNDKAIVGICLICLEKIRPDFAPAIVGISSENAAHRIAVLWENKNGETQKGVYIPHRDTIPLLMRQPAGKSFRANTTKPILMLRKTKAR